VCLKLCICTLNKKLTGRILRGHRPLLRYDEVADFAEQGAFNLRHTFPEAAQGSTDNLMDYTQDKYALLKAQWDLIHNPETTTRLFDEMEDGASQETAPTKEAKWEKFTGDITTFISPAGLPITIPKPDSVLIAHGPSTYQSSTGKVYDIPSAENVLIAFKLEKGVTYVPYIAGNNGENIFYGYITDPSKMDFFEDSQTASLPASFSVKLLEGASPIIKQCQIKPEQVFADTEYAQYNPNSKYRAAGPMAYRINDVSLKAGGFYYSKYRKVTLFENCNVLKVAIEKDPS